MRTTKFYSIAIIAIVVFSFSQQSFAQLGNIHIYNSPGYINTINTALSNSVMTSHMKKGSSGVSKSKSSGQSASYEEVPAYRKYPAVQFKSTGTRLTLQEYLALVQLSPQDKAELKIMILELFKLYESQPAAKSYPNDWALAFVSYVGLNSHIYHGRTEKPTIPFEQNVGVRDVIAEYATDNGIFNNVTDRQKQELYELLVMTGGLTYYYYRKALSENNAEDIKALKLQAAQNLKLVGIKL